MIKPNQTCIEIPEGVKTEHMEKSLIKIGEKKLETQDTLKEVNLRSDEDKRPTYISAQFSAQQQEELPKLLMKYKDCFA